MNQSHSNKPDGAPRGKTRILLVDDEALVREELGALLADEGYEVVTGADGEEGLALFRSTAPDMVITDVRMPRRDGLSVAMTIRQEDPSVPVTVITGHGTESMAIEALRAGVTDFIKKPVRLDDLTAAVQRMEAARPVGLTFTELPTAVALVEHSWTYHLQNDANAVPLFVDVMLKRAAAGLDRMAVLELSLALRELILNAVEHGNLELTYDEKTHALESGTLEKLLRERALLPKYQERHVVVTATREDRRLTIRIVDRGRGFDWRSLPDPTDAANLLLSHGRGVLLARLSVDALTFNSVGNEATISKLF